jgi:hypothetical protein
MGVLNQSEAEIVIVEPLDASASSLKKDWSKPRVYLQKASEWRDAAVLCLEYRL